MPCWDPARLCPCLLPSGDPCLRAAPEQLNAAGERFKRQRVQLASALFSNTCSQTPSWSLTAEGSLRVYFSSPFSLSHLIICFALKQLKELKMLPISLALSPDQPAGPVHVMAAGVLIHRWELILALSAAWATPWLSTGQGEERGREDGLTLIPPAVYTCGSWRWFKASLLALTL